MKKMFASCLLLILLCTEGRSQSRTIRPQSIGFSFIANDYATAERIRTTSLSQVLREKTAAKLGDMGHGFAAHYIKGLTPGIDFMSTLGVSFVQFNLPGRTPSNDELLLEVDASANFKMFPEGVAVVNPYLTAGVGVSKYTNVFGAFMPLGGGLSINLFDEAKFFTQLQYRVPVVTDGNRHHIQISFGIAGRL